MGCGGSMFVPRYDVRGQGVNVIPLATELGFTEGDVHQLYRYFLLCDLEGTGMLKIDEFIVYNQITNRSFGKLVFRLFDADNDGLVTFEEFLVAAWNSFTLDDLGLPLFAFRLFDADNSGYLSPDELSTMIKVVSGGSPRSIETAWSMIKKNDTNSDGLISFSEWMHMTQRSQVIMFPAFEMRDIFRHKMLGTSRWHALTSKRRLRFGNALLPEILPRLHVKPTSYFLKRPEEFVEDFRPRRAKDGGGGGGAGVVKRKSVQATTGNFGSASVPASSQQQQTSFRTSASGGGGDGVGGRGYHEAVAAATAAAAALRLHSGPSGSNLGPQSSTSPSPSRRVSANNSKANSKANSRRGSRVAVASDGSSDGYNNMHVQQPTPVNAGSQLQQRRASDGGHQKHAVELKQLKTVHRKSGSLQNFRSSSLDLADVRNSSYGGDNNSSFVVEDSSSKKLPYPEVVGGKARRQTSGVTGGAGGGTAFETTTKVGTKHPRRSSVG